MMGFGTVIAAMVSVSIILLTSYVCSNGGFYMADRITDSVMEMQDNENDILKTGIEITNISTHNETNINVSLNNKGSTKIGDFDHMDVIVNYFDTSDNAKTRWIPYRQSVSKLENSWTNGNITPDIVNPEILDPDEEIELKISLEDPMKDEKKNWIMVVAPNGAKASRYFDT